MATIYARVTDEGTAAGETAVCAACLRTATGAELDYLSAVDARGEFVDVTGNEACRCNLCGREGGE